jgi:hypothetical protein
VAGNLTSSDLHASGKPRHGSGSLHHANGHYSSRHGTLPVSQSEGRQGARGPLPAETINTTKLQAPQCRPSPVKTSQGHGRAIASRPLCKPFTSGSHEATLEAIAAKRCPPDCSGNFHSAAAELVALPVAMLTVIVVAMVAMVAIVVTVVAVPVVAMPGCIPAIVPPTPVPAPVVAASCVEAGSLDRDGLCSGGR